MSIAIVAAVVLLVAVVAYVLYGKSQGQDSPALIDESDDADRLSVRPAHKIAQSKPAEDDDSKPDTRPKSQKSAEADKPRVNLDDEKPDQQIASDEQLAHDDGTEGVAESNNESEAAQQERAEGGGPKAGKSKQKRIRERGTKRFRKRRRRSP